MAPVPPATWTFGWATAQARIAAATAATSTSADVIDSSTSSGVHGRDRRALFHEASFGAVQDPHQKARCLYCFLCLGYVVIVHLAVTGWVAKDRIRTGKQHPGPFLLALRR